MAEFCKDCDGITICDFCSRFIPDRETTDDGAECESGICQATGKEVNRSGGVNCDNFRCFKLDT